jgi:hypothetical protein
VWTSVYFSITHVGICSWKPMKILQRRDLQRAKRLK